MQGEYIPQIKYGGEHVLGEYIPQVKYGGEHVQGEYITQVKYGGGHVQGEYSHRSSTEGSTCKVSTATGQVRRGVHAR